MVQKSNLRDEADELFGDQRQAANENAKRVLAVHFVRRGETGLRCQYAYLTEVEHADDWTWLKLTFAGRLVEIRGRRLQKIEEGISAHTLPEVLETYRSEFDRDPDGPVVESMAFTRLKKG